MRSPARLQEILEDLALFPDREGKIEALISYGQDYQHPNPELVPRTPENKVPGCESEVFVSSTPNADGTLTFHYAVDNPQGISAMALGAILKSGLSGAPLEEVLQVSNEVIYDIFGRELSMGKSLGLTGIVKMTKHEAEKWLRRR